MNPQNHISSGANSPVTWDYLIVGAGYAGAVLAERLASQCGATCLVIDKRTHIGGNAHDHYDKAGVLLHTYGPHYFRSNSERIVAYLSQFTEWHPVEYKILSWAEGRHWQFPINLNTFEQLIGRPSTSGEMEATLAEWRVPIENPANSEEVIVSQVGTRLYEMFFKNYTRKQWRREPSELDASVCGRIPIRTNRDDRYLSEKFQALPKDGYTAMFGRMLAHPKIEVRLNADYREVRKIVQFRHLIYTGAVDEYFDHCFGALVALWLTLGQTIEVGDFGTSKQTGRTVGTSSDASTTTNALCRIHRRIGNRLWHCNEVAIWCTTRDSGDVPTCFDDPIKWRTVHH